MEEPKKPQFLYDIRISFSPATGKVKEDIEKGMQDLIAKNVTEDSAQKWSKLVFKDTGKDIFKAGLRKVTPRDDSRLQKLREESASGTGKKQEQEARWEWYEIEDTTEAHIQEEWTYRLGAREEGKHPASLDTHSPKEKYVGQGTMRGFLLKNLKCLEDDLRRLHGDVQWLIEYAPGGKPYFRRPPVLRESRKEVEDAKFLESDVIVNERKDLAGYNMANDGEDFEGYVMVNDGEES